ncbi:MAG: ATP-binding protein [Chlamydiia bacterium]|nr:ATP-binding protein [Chlamydiia bacterium]
MERFVEKELLKWKMQKHRVPLIVRGARQIGKTFVIEKFGKEYFKHFIKINFERDPKAESCFQSLNPTEILSALEIYTRQEIHAEETLLFLDEIQACPRALMALRYFKEELPHFHVIAAGSLLEFALKEEQFRMPVGRVEYLYMYPLCYAEYLQAQGERSLLKALKQCTTEKPLPQAGHERALESLRQYMAIGGMPEVIETFLSDKSYLNAQRLQARLLNTFRDDFGKYAKHLQHRYLELVFDKAPGLISELFKYVKIDPQLDPRPIREAVLMLVDAGILSPIYATAATGVPLISFANLKKLKLLFLDIGLVQRACRVDLQWILDHDLMLVNRGALAEQFVGQELLSLFSCYEKGKLYFWERNKPGSSAEIDYVINLEGRILPIEVKAGATGRLRSLKIFMKEKKVPLGIRISSAPLSFEDNILNVPLYMISEIPRLIHDV